LTVAAVRRSLGNKIRVHFRSWIASSYARTRAPALLCLAASLCGCAGISEIRQTELFLGEYFAGEYEQASTVLGGESGLDYDAEQLLTSLHLAMALRAEGRFAAAQTAFDRAESQLLWKSDEIASVEDLLAAGFTLVGNDLMVSYQGTIYDGVLVNTFKALNAMHGGDLARARVELNRADQRQENAVHQLAAKVAALGSGEEDEEQYQEQVNRSMGEVMDPEGPVAARLQAVESLGRYRGLRNPFTDWLHGVFRLASGEANRASNLFRNAAVLEGRRNSHVLADLVEAERVASGGARTDGRVWVIHEDGTGPYLEAFRFDLPIYTGDGVLVVSTALPEFRRGAPAAGSLQIHVAGQEYRTEPLLDLDRYAATEFRAGYDSVVFKAVAGTVIRSLIQLEIQRQSREHGGLASVLNVVAPIASAVVTQADIRIWRALPRSIGVASLVRPDDGRMRISAGPGAARELILPPGRFVLVVVKTIRADVPPAVHVAAFGNE